MSFHSDEDSRHGTDGVPVVVMDGGSYRLRAGFQSDPAPRVVIPSLVGVKRNPGIALASGQRCDVVGNDAWRNRGVLDCTYPVREGIVQNWQDIERLWSDVVYRSLRVSPENYCFVVTEPPNNSAANKEAALEVLMETFNARSCFMGSTAVMTLYSYGLSTGVVIDSGLQNTTCVPIHEGYALGRHTTVTDVAGERLTHRLRKLLGSLGYAFSTAIEVDTVNAVKESLCFVRQPGDSATSATSHSGAVSGAGAGGVDTSAGAGSSPTSVTAGGGAQATGFTLPDGQFIPLVEEAHKTTEALFDFSLVGPSHETNVKVFEDSGAAFESASGMPKGLSWLVYGAINHCEPTLRPLLYKSIVLGGGTSLFKGLQTRLLAELRQLYREQYRGQRVADTHVAAQDCRQFSAWLGGVMISRLSMFPQLTVSRSEYQEQGKSVVHYKCL
jgi:actin-related protein